MYHSYTNLLLCLRSLEGEPSPKRPRTMNGDLSPEETELLNNSSNGHLATAVYNADIAEEEQESLSPDSTTSPELNLRIRFVRICLDFQGFYFRKSIERSKLLFVFATLCSNF